MADETPVEETISWEIEPIGSESSLFYRVDSRHLKGGRLHPGVFKEIGGYISADWDKYSAAIETLARVGQDRAHFFGVLRLGVAGIREIEGLEVLHKPDFGNQSHSGIFGVETPPPLKLKRRTELLRRFHDWELVPKVYQGTSGPES